MDFYTPGTSFYPCPLSAADVLKPQPTPPPIYYLKNHMCVVYNDSDWPTTSENDEDADKEEGESNSNYGLIPGNANMVRVQPLGLLSVRMREYDEKQRVSGGISDNNHTSEEGKFASPGMPSAPFPGALLTFVAEQPTPATKADIPQGPPSILKYNKLLAESNVKPRARKPLGAANTITNAKKNPKAASEPTRHRIQVVLTHNKEEKENLPCVSSESDEIDDPILTTQLARRDPSKDQERVQAQDQLLYDIKTLPDPFLLTSEDECDEPFEGGQQETTGNSARGAIATNFDPTLITTATAVISASKSCLRAANAPPKGLTVSFKDPLLRFHFYHYPDPNDIWSLCGLPMRLTCKSFIIFPTSLRPLTFKPQFIPRTKPLD